MLTQTQSDLSKHFHFISFHFVSLDLGDGGIYSLDIYSPAQPLYHGMRLPAFGQVDKAAYLSRLHRQALGFQLN